MARKIYKARNFAQFSNLDAQVIGERLETLGDELTPADLVADARNNKSPLHPYFEWDDSVAAGQYRLQQATQILTHIEIKIDDESQNDVPAYCNVEIERDEGNVRRYVPIDVVMSDAGLRAQVLELAWKELESWRNRYERYRKYLRPIFPVIEKALKRKEA